MDLLKRKEIADYLLNKEIISSIPEKDYETLTDEPRKPKCGTFIFPDGLTPTPIPLDPKPDISAPLPKADIVVITWTGDEQEGLADIFTHPFVSPTFYTDERRKKFSWYPYNRFFSEKYKSQIRQGAPSFGLCRNPKNQLGNYFLSKVGKKTVLVFKSELHLNQDGIYLNDDRTIARCQERYWDETGYATLPVKELFKQIIEETGANHIITTGTGGASMLNHNMGDVVITRGAAFLLSSEFEKEKFNNKFKRKRNGEIVLVFNGISQRNIV